MKIKLYLTCGKGAEDLSALRPTDGSMGEKGGANGEQPQAKGQGEQDTGVL